MCGRDRVAQCIAFVPIEGNLPSGHISPELSLACCGVS